MAAFTPPWADPASNRINATPPKLPMVAASTSTSETTRPGSSPLAWAWAAVPVASRVPMTAQTQIRYVSDAAAHPSAGA